MRGELADLSWVAAVDVHRAVRDRRSSRVTLDHRQWLPHPVAAQDLEHVRTIVLERPQSKLLGTVTAMTAFRNIAVDALM